MKPRMIFAALAVLALSGPAGAEPMRMAQADEPGALPPHEIVTILRSTGFDPLSQPVRRGPNYVMRAVDDTDREVRVVLNARSGKILSVTPVEMASRTPPGYIPPPSYRPAPRGGYDSGLNDDDDDAPPPRSYGAPRSPVSGPGAPPRTSNAVPPPRGGSLQPDDDALQPSRPNVIPADPDRSGLLPPPPERFPQRAAPAAPPKPKPVTRAAAAPPKQPPVPKPKPGANAPAWPTPSATSQAAPPSQPAAQTPPPVEETPN